MKINLIGNIFGVDGYSIHTKNLLNCLNNEGIDTRLETNLFQGFEQLCNDVELEAIKKQDNKERINLFIGIPDFWRFYLDKDRKFIGFLVWEGNKIPKYWIKTLLDERVNQIWVPSEHTRKAILNTCIKNDVKKIKNKIYIIPHGVDTEIFKPLEEKKKKEEFVFMVNKGWRGTLTDRGGIQFLIKSFVDEFKPNEKVKLILKINPAYLPTNDLKLLFSKLNLPEETPKIAVCLDTITPKSMNSMYNEADCYVVTQMADAFDLGSAEAMASGIPAIVSYFGGQKEHIHNKEFLIKKGKLKLVEDDINYEGISWFYPDVKEIRKKLRWAFNNKSLIKKEGKKARKFIEQNYTWKKTGSKAKQALGYINKRNVYK